MKHDQRLPNAQQPGRIDRVLLSVRATDPDASVLEERCRSRQVTGVNAFGVAIQEVGNLRLRQHAVDVAWRPQSSEPSERLTPLS